MRDWGFVILENTGLPRRARGTLENWDHILDGDREPSFKWALKGTHCLIFLTKDNREFVLILYRTSIMICSSALRQSEKGIKTAFTMTDTEWSEIHWPTFLTRNPSLNSEFANY